jgi:hypothetical protein
VTLGGDTHLPPSQRDLLLFCVGYSLENLPRSDSPGQYWLFGSNGHDTSNTESLLFPHDSDSSRERSTSDIWWTVCVRSHTSSGVLGATALPVAVLPQMVGHPLVVTTTSQPRLAYMCLLLLEQPQLSIGNPSPS